MAGPNMSVADFTRMLEVHCKMEFAKQYEQTLYTENPWMELCQQTTSDGDTEYYGFGSNIPKPTRIDNAQREMHAFDDYSYSLKNYTYGLTVPIRREVYEDDRNNYIKGKIDYLVQGHKMTLNDNFGTLLTGGTSTLCFDGQFFFDIDHPGTANQTNDDQNKAVATAAVATGLSNALDVVKVMWAYQDRDGNPLSINPTHVLTGVSDTCVAWDMILNTPGAAGTANWGWNPLYKKLTHIRFPIITATTTWYLFDNSKPIKPFIFQRREPVKVEVAPPGDDHPDVFLLHTYERYRMGYGAWFLAILGDA